MAQRSSNVATLTKQEQIIAILQGSQTTKRYGVQIEKANSDPDARITYLYDADGFTPAHMDYTNNTFDYGSWRNVWFVKENYPVMLGMDGEVKYKLNPNNYALQEDGVTASDITDSSYSGNVMSRFPLVWLHMSQDSTYEYIIVSNVQVDNTYHAYAFTDTSGNVKTEMFLACYTGSLISSKLRSLSGKYPMWEQTAQQELNYAAANGSGWCVRTWSQRNLVNALLTIISKSDDSQTAFGGGVYNTYVNDRSRYYGMLPSGGLNTAGQFFGYNDGTHHVKTFHIEDWWGNQWERIAGLINDNGTIKVSLYGPYNVTGSGYTAVPGCPTPQGTSGGYITDCYTTAYGRIPYTAGGTGASSSTYLCDYMTIDNYTVLDLMVGGWCGIDPKDSGAYWTQFYTTNVSAFVYGASLSYV